MTKTNSQQPAEDKINVGDNKTQPNQTGLRPHVIYCKTKQVSDSVTSGQNQQQVANKKQYPPTPAWFFTLGTKPDAWGPCPGHMFKQTEKSISQNRIKDTSLASIRHQHQPTYLQKSMNAGDSNINISNNSIEYKPSKAFLEKCATTQQTLLKQIKSQYHDQLRSLYQNELNADVIVQIGANFTKPLHGCILASRVFRFYNTLRLFKLNSSDLNNQKAVDVHSSLDLSDDHVRSVANENISKDSDLINYKKQVYCIPSELISPDLFKNFTRRIYLDEDVRDEELRLTTKFGDWLKLNKPHLMTKTHIPNRYSPNHKDTFRTMIPDFVVKESPTNNSTMALSTEPDSIDSTSSNHRMDSLDKSSSSSVRTFTAQQDDGQQTSGQNQGEDIVFDPNSVSLSSTLPRTETFERMSSKLEEMNLDAQSSTAQDNIDMGPNQHAPEDSTRKSFQGVDNIDNYHISSNLNAHLNSSQEDDKSDYGADISSADGSNAPTPTSNTPFSFSTPLSSSKDNVNARSIVQSQSPHLVPKQRVSTNQKSRPSSILNNDISGGRNKTNSTSTNSTSSSPANRTIKSFTGGKVQESLPVAQKRSTAITRASPSTRTPTTTPTSMTKAQPPSNPIVTRAKPISLERAQSPILMGKQSRHQFKSTSITNHGQHRHGPNDRRTPSGTPLQPTTGYESETLGSEISDSGSFALESSSAPGGYISIDRYTLASYSKLAEAMTRMFIEEIEADVIINVGGSKQIRAHKCILATRSAYLAEAIEKQQYIYLNNNSRNLSNITKDDNDGAAATDAEVENNGELSKQNKFKVEDMGQTYINLTDFSYSTVHFAVLHLYSGIVKVTDDLELEELAKLTYLLHVGTLRQVCQHNLRMTYCHFFHKPCNICSLGVLKTLPLAWRYDYSDLYSKCLQWIGTHFANIFCLKEFSELRPTDLIEECYSATLTQLQPDNIIQRTLECQKLLKNLPRVKWTESIIGLVGRQLEDFCHYVADNYDKIIQTESFIGLGKNCWECEILEENLLAAMNHLKPDMGCKCLVLLHKIECSNETAFNDDSTNHYSESFANLVSKMRKYCERYLIRDAAQVVHCSSWKQMNPSLQRKIKDQALITVDFEDPTRHLSNKPKLTSSNIGAKSISQPTQATSMLHRHHSGHNSSSDDGSSRPSSVSRPTRGAGAQLPPMKSKKIVSRHVKVLK